MPVCVVPFGRDQHEVAMRVAVARCGTRLPAAKLTPQRLRAKVFEAMTMTDGGAGWPTAWPPPVAWRTGRI